MARPTRSRLLNFWPGFVDALASLLMVITFVLMIFMVSQYYLSDVLTGQDQVLVQLRHKLNELTRILGFEQQAKTALEKKVDSMATEIYDSESAKVAAENKIIQLQTAVSDMNERILVLKQALEASDVQIKVKSIEIDELGRQLNEVLAKKVKDLRRYRSEFFGLLRQTLGERDDIRIVGDRFVFQSEVLFASGSSQIGKPGRIQLKQFADTLKSLMPNIPSELDWILRVDGHTDKRPVRSKFRSNWDLSTARAIAVVNFLISQGIPSKRLAATGFAEFQPLDEGDTPQALKRNRRIEMRFDQN